ncbi:MAG: replication initiator protein WhiP [Desulfurococcales archaeon]|nr:replication initiator protein WhiP [Desulfurococcales archaeon]
MDERRSRILERLLDNARRKQGGPRSGPRSKLVDALMVLLLGRPMRAAEIAEVLGYDTRYISSYLSYWKTRGYVEYVSGFWQLTPLGEEYAREVIARETSSEYDKFAGLARKLASENVSRTINNKKKARGRQPRGSSLPFIAGKTIVDDNKRQKRREAAECMLSALREVLDPDEIEVISRVLEHYTEWGTTYIYTDQLAESMQADSTWLLRILRGLQSKGILYIYTDPRLGVRIGFTRRFKEELESC